ncbi:hypothetical protein NN561_011433 [Cricetulus griseus]
MAEHPPLLDTAQILSSDISLLSAPIVSADGTQQVILVQVNPGEAFTIRREDGQFQCITESMEVSHHILCCHPSCNAFEGEGLATLLITINHDCHR